MDDRRESPSSSFARCGTGIPSPLGQVGRFSGARDSYALVVPSPVQCEDSLNGVILSWCYCGNESDNTQHTEKTMSHVIMVEVIQGSLKPAGLRWFGGNRMYFHAGPRTRCRNICR